MDNLLIKKTWRRPAPCNVGNQNNIVKIWRKEINQKLQIFSSWTKD
jgi:hypothetical protein